MLLTTPILLLASAAFISALPVEREVEKRICGSIILPSTLVQLQANNPDTSFPNTAQTNGSFFVYQDVNEPSGKLPLLFLISLFGHICFFNSLP
jgi:hypothetical protein